MENGMVRPSEMGLNPQKLYEMLEILEKTVELHSITVRYEGKKILEGAWEPFTLDDPQMMHSLSKIGTSLCIGFAVDEKKLRLEDKVLDYVREELPEDYAPALEELSIYHLLTMQTGSPECCNNVWFSKLEKEWEREWLKESKIKEDIGKVFHYDSGCSYTLSRIVTRVMGQNCLSIMQERVFSKMGLGEIDWLTSPEGHNTGGWGMYLTSGKIAALAQLLLQKGSWNGEQLVPAWWVEEMSKPRVVIPGAEEAALDSYAYHIKAGKEIFAAEGAFGQYLICFRNYPIGIGITAGTPDYVATDICLKYLKEAVESKCTPEEAEQAERKLADKIKELKLPMPKGDENRAGDGIRVLLDKTIVFSENPRKIQKALFSQEKEDELRILMMVDGEEKQCTAGFKRWVRNDLYPGDFRQEYHCVAYSFEENALNISVGLINTSYREEYRFCIEEDKLVCTWKPNVTYLPAELDMTWRFSGALDGTYTMGVFEQVGKKPE